MSSRYALNELGYPYDTMVYTMRSYLLLNSKSLKLT
jgi:hypothetical protein